MWFSLGRIFGLWLYISFGGDRRQTNASALSFHHFPLWSFSRCAYKASNFQFLSDQKNSNEIENPFTPEKCSISSYRLLDSWKLWNWVIFPPPCLSSTEPRNISGNKLFDHEILNCYSKILKDIIVWSNIIIILYLTWITHSHALITCSHMLSNGHALFISSYTLIGGLIVLL